MSLPLVCGSCSALFTMGAAASTCAKYARRRPKLTSCYKVVAEHLDSFIAHRQLEGRPLPKFEVDEFEAFLKCGILAFGFLRLRCNGCGDEKIVAFSCKNRGFCPSYEDLAFSHVDEKAKGFLAALTRETNCMRPDKLMQLNLQLFPVPRVDQVTALDK